MHLEDEWLFTAIADVVRHLVLFDYMAIVLPELEDMKSLVYLIEAQKERLYFYSSAIYPHAGIVMAWILKHNRPYVAYTLHDLQPFAGCFEGCGKAGLQSYCVLPLMIENRAVGVLILAAKNPDQYNLLDLSFFKKIAAVIAVALDNRLADKDASGLKDPPIAEKVDLRDKEKPVFKEIIGKSQVIQNALNHLMLVAGTDSSVLISGETGTGKELIARAICYLSQRNKMPFITVNCAALPAGLIESELFGHERGAFTGAISKRLGRFELAHGGTIFLDEIGDLSLEIQAKLLRVLQYREFERVGSSETIKTDVRLIAATNRNLTEAMRNNGFRADLYYRLNVFPIFLPPLRERKEDIPLLTWYFLERCTKRMKKPVLKIDIRTMGQLMAYPWPGNIRELESVLERAVILSQGPILEIIEEFPRSSNRLGGIESHASITSPSHGKVITKDNKERLLELLKQMRGNHAKTAQFLGISRMTLWRRLKSTSKNPQKEM